jgi:hypothetical protein
VKRAVDADDVLHAGEVSPLPLYWVVHIAPRPVAPALRTRSTIIITSLY